MKAPIKELKAAAEEAIAALDGPTKAARRLSELSGEPCSRERVSRWLDRGVAPKWAPYVEQATGIPRQRLRPDYYHHGDAA